MLKLTIKSSLYSQFCGVVATRVSGFGVCTECRAACVCVLSAVQERERVHCKVDKQEIRKMECRRRER